MNTYFLMLISISVMFQPAKPGFSNSKQEITLLYNEKKYVQVIENCQIELGLQSSTTFNAIRSGEFSELPAGIPDKELINISQALFYIKYILESRLKLSEPDAEYLQLREELIRVAEVVNNPVYITYGYNRLAKDLFTEEHFEESAKWFLKSLEIKNSLQLEIQQLSQEDNAALLLNYYSANFRLGRIFSRLLNYKEAVNYYRKAISFTHLMNDTSRMALAHYQIGNTWTRDKEYDSAMYHYQKARALFFQNQELEKLSAAYSNIGNVYNFKQNLDLALAYYDSANMLLKDMDDKVGQAYLLNNTANLNGKNKNFPKAIAQFKTSLTLANEIEDKTLIKVNAEALADLYKETHSYDSAFKYYYQTQALNTELYNDELAASIHQLEITFDTKEKEWEIFRQQEVIKSKNIQQLYLALIITLFIFLTLIGWFAYRSKRKANKLLLLQKNLAEQHSKEKSILMQELHHRVKNNMQLISSVLNLQSDMLTDQSAITAVSESKGRVDAMSLIHQKLYFTNNVTHVSMREYVQQLIQNIAFSFGFHDSGKLNLKIAVADIQLKVDLAIPLCIIINELLTNAFKYAFSNTEKAELNVILKADFPDLKLEIADNGVGIPEDQADKISDSFGLKLVQTMIDQLDATLAADSSSGTSYFIFIPDALQESSPELLHA